MNRYLLLLLIIYLPFSVFSQEEEQTIELHDHSKAAKRNRISFMMATTYIFNTVDVNHSEGFHPTNTFVPTIGVNYTYLVNKKFALGLLNDLELASYTVKIKDKEYLSRDYRFITSVAGAYRVVHHFMVMLGYGLEFEKGAVYNVLRMGVEYDIRLRDQWDVLFGVNYDYKGQYSTINFSISFGKSFGKDKAFKKKGV